MFKYKMVVFFGFYDDFARFFIAIRKHLSDREIASFFWANNLSGYLYWLFRAPGVAWFAMVPFIYVFTFYLNGKNFGKLQLSCEEIEWLIEYHEKRFYGLYKLALKVKAKIYFCYMFEWAKKNNADMFIISGDSRLISRIAKLVAEKLKIKTLFFEQGPNGTTILDPIGVNANCSFRKMVPIRRAAYENFSTTKKNTVHKRSNIYRISDYLIDMLLPNFLFPEIVENNIKSSLKKIWGKKNKVVREGGPSRSFFEKKFILLILQVPNDANMILHSPYYNSQKQIVADVIDNVPDDTMLIIREHPLYIRSYDKNVYFRASQAKNVRIDNDTPLSTLLDKATLVIVNNSTVGFEAILHQKPTLVLGDSYYDSCKLVTKWDGVSPLDVVIKRAIKFNPVKADYDDYISWMFSKNFIPGHFRSECLDDLSKSIFKRILD